MSQEADKTPFKGRELIVALCGGIAAYKTADLVSKLARRDSELAAARRGSDVTSTPERGRLEQLVAEVEELRGENEFLSSEVARYADKVAALGKGPTPIARIKR